MVFKRKVLERVFSSHVAQRTMYHCELNMSSMHVCTKCELLILFYIAINVFIVAFYTSEKVQGSLVSLSNVNEFNIHS
jgi:hypothetical protein